MIANEVEIMRDELRPAGAAAIGLDQYLAMAQQSPRSSRPSCATERPDG